MAIADDLKKTLTDPTPLYFAAGTADYAVQQAKKVPGLIDQLRAEAPARIEAVRNTDPKAVQERAKEDLEAVAAKVVGVVGALGSIDPKSIDPKKIGETAQDLALRGVGVAAEYAVRAKETYDRVAEHGEQAVRQWRGEVAEDIIDVAAVVEPEPASEPEPAEASADAEKPAAKRTATRRTAAKKATPVE
ncbi:hypothetical protein DEJ50_15105 [Streptomyces venezuelae]|uniref:Heparin binding hemagglutinin HbhA n=1 Tax=Streptomyces venezuelae TaxID=54571 RepID=A0A5P2D1C8_STRVZ|nr:hypothetical protein [Streptomyces venezuelae]QES48944.1 hypothetical protein DEJ50_15105 [Streptomyces venezuelae]